MSWPKGLSLQSLWLNIWAGPPGFKLPRITEYPGANSRLVPGASSDHLKLAETHRNLEDRVTGSPGPRRLSWHDYCHANRSWTCCTKGPEGLEVQHNNNNNNTYIHTYRSHPRIMYTGWSKSFTPRPQGKWLNPGQNEWLSNQVQLI